MKIVFNTTQPHAACSQMYMDAFRNLEGITFFDNNLEKYQVGLFMTYDHNLISSVKSRYPNLKIGLIDPRSYRVMQDASLCDFLVVDSIEMEDFWRCSKKPIFRYAEYPEIPYIQKKHTKKDTVSIGYHGNRIHLECMSQNVTPALERLGLLYNLELVVTYNGPSPTGREKWYPKNVDVRHIKWNRDVYVNTLASCDIGISPNNMIHDKNIKSLTSTQNKFNYSEDDYSLRFKMPSNPGRIIVFGKLGIPVVADFYPSAIQYLQGDAGFVAHHTDGWFYSLEQLIKSHTLRSQMGTNLQNLVRNKFDYQVQNTKFINFLEKILTDNKESNTV